MDVEDKLDAIVTFLATSVPKGFQGNAFVAALDAMDTHSIKLHESATFGVVDRLVAWLAQLCSAPSATTHDYNFFSAMLSIPAAEFDISDISKMTIPVDKAGRMLATVSLSALSTSSGVAFPPDIQAIDC